MKKLLLITVMIIGIVSTGFAITETLSDKPVLVDWEFSPEVSSTLGYNLDSSTFGMAGVAKFDLKSNIHEKAHKNFTGEGTMYGYVEIEDLEIRVWVDDATKDYDSQASGTTNPLDISVGAITGKVYMGPAYLVLKNNGHNEVRFLENGLDDGDLDFSAINYSIIPAYYTGSLQGYTLGEATTAVANPIAVSNTVSTDTAGPVQNASFTQLGALSIGFAVPNLVTIELGAATKYDFKTQVENAYHNPYSLSLYVELTAIENLSVKLKGSFIDGNDRVPYMTDNNPITFGILAGYSLPVGDKVFTPKLGAEMSIVNKRKLSAEGITAAGGGSLFNEQDVERVMTMPMEIALGFNFTWKDKGLDANESDHIAYAPKDVKVSDGASLAFIYGATPAAYFSESSVNYIGVKLALWDSEDGDKTGILPGLKTSFILNANYALASEVDLKEAVNAATKEGGVLSSDVLESGTFSTTSRIDVGAALELKYIANVVNPYIGLIYKSFDLTDDFEAKLTSKAVGAPAETETVYDTKFANQQDFRLKLGFEIVKLIANTTITVEWLSGDMINEDGNDSGPYDDYDYFKNETSNADDANGGNDIQNTSTAAKLGYISLGFKVTF